MKFASKLLKQGWIHRARLEAAQDRFLDIVAPDGVMVSARCPITGSRAGETIYPTLYSSRPGRGLDPGGLSREFADLPRASAKV
jgi:hypothetical protein